MIKNKNNTPSPENGGAATKTTLQKQRLFIIIAAALLAAGLIFYFLIYPMIQQSVDLLSYLYDGEAIDEYGELCLVEPKERVDISKIEVKNQYGEYVLEETSTSAGKTYRLVGGGNAIIDEQSLAGVVVSAGKPLGIAADSKHYRANETATEEDLKSYGLDAASDPAYFRVTLRDGSSYRIFIGNALSAGNGYYALVDDATRRNKVTNEDGTVTEYYIVYVLEATTAKTMLAGSTSIISTTLGEYVGNGIYSLKNYRVERIIDGERALIISVKKNDSIESLSASAYELEYPSAYLINDADFNETVLASLASVNAEAIVAMGDMIYDPEVYELFFLDLDKERIEAGTDKNYAVLYYKCLDSDNKNEYENKLYFSEKKLLANGEEVYYIYAPEIDVIARVQASEYDFISWTAMKYTDARLFFAAIGSLDYFSLYSAEKKADLRFSLTGNAYTYHVEVTDADGKNAVLDKNGEPKVFDVKYKETASGRKFEGEFENFRDLFYVLITRSFEISEDTVYVGDDATSVYTVEAQVVQRDRGEQFNKYEGGNRVVENGSYAYVSYDGGYVIVENLKGKSANGYDLAYDVAYYDEATNKYFVKAEDSADGEMKPRNYKYDEDKMLPIFLDMSETTAEYTVTKYTYQFYNMYNETVNADGTVTKTVNQTYMMVLPTIEESIYRIEADGTRTLVETKTSENDGMASVIRRISVEKLFSDAAKVVAGSEIDREAVD